MMDVTTERLFRRMARRPVISALLGLSISAALTVLGLFLFVSAPSRATAGPPRIGVNLDTLNSQSTAIPFVDVFKMSAPWVPTSVAGRPAEPLELDRNGWIARLAPGQSGRARLFDNGLGRYPAGIYTLLYDGKGQIRVYSSGVSVVSQAPGVIKVKVEPVASPTGGITILETATDPADPIRRIRLILPGFENSYASDPFNPVFLKRLQPFKTIRFMGWESVNRSTAQNWDDRRTPDYETQSIACCGSHRMTGVALEYQIDVANRLAADAWLNVPVMATDDYVARMADLVKHRLKPGLKVYLEYGNELWNPTFIDNYDYVRDRGVAAGLSNDRASAGRYQYVRRAAEVFQIWTKTFGTDRAPPIRVIAGQMGDPSSDDQMLGYMKANGLKADVFAIGAYVTPHSLVTWRPVDISFYDAILAQTPADIADKLDREVRDVDRALIRRHAEVAGRYGLALAAYEGGQGLSVAWMPPSMVGAYRERVAEALSAANRDPAMAKVYKDLMDTWYESGGGLFMHFSDVGRPGWFGSWGLLEYQDQDPQTSPKYKAVTDYIAHAKRTP